MVYNIYSKDEIKERTQRKKVYIESYLINKKSPFVIVCPGGAYKFVSDSNEGKPFAEEFNKAGFNAFVLFYSVGPGNARYPYPLEDLARAIKYIKHHASDFNIDADKFALIGSSAGGHLCSIFCTEYEKYDSEYLGCEYNLRPNVLMLTYPLISMENPTHKESQKNFLGLMTGKKDREKASVQYLINKEFPPTFMWHNKDDMSVKVENSIWLKEALDNVGIKNELLLYESGGHGIGLAQGKEAQGWINAAIDFLKTNIS